MNIWKSIVLTTAFSGSLLFAKEVAYIHGDVAADGTIPSGSQAPYDQMLITDEGDTGLSEFKTLVEAQGYTITQHYDQTTVLNATFLDQFDVVIFGLHQKVWSQAEQDALDIWIRAGGGILMYNDSAAGGLFSQVGIRNTTGQNAVNSILSNYGMQVAVDQGGGTRGYVPNTGSPNAIVWDVPIFEGEGVSPVAVDPSGPATALIPLSPANRVSNGTLSIDAQGVTIANPIWSVIAHAPIGKGNVIAIFDRQPMWNNGPGSDINEEDNKEVLRRTVRFLAGDYGNSLEWLQFSCNLLTPPMMEVSYRQWSGGAGQLGVNYVARNQKFALEQQAELDPSAWRMEASLVEAISTTPFGDGESELVNLRLKPDNNASSWFARLVVNPQVPLLIPTAQATGTTIVSLSGSAWLEASITNATTQFWEKTSGPGVVTFTDGSASQTSATFTQAGSYQLRITASNSGETASDTLTILVVNDNDIEVALNCAGPAYSGNNGFDYLADQFFNGGGVDNFPGNAVANTNDDALYNTARSKSDFTGYTIPVPNGNYLVILQFAETFFTASDKRVFDLSLEGNLMLDNLDLFQTAPGKWVAYEEVYPVTISDGTIDISVASSVNNPLINAIVVVKQP